MRWTDLPPDRGPDDARASVLSRGEWDDLRQRLERLPPGHPSRPGDPGEGQAEAGPADQDQADQDQADDGSSAARRGVQDGEPGRAREPDGHRERDPARAAPPDRREPYRPWFTAGEPPEPWFADPGG